ncbi:MAG TPA: tyrosine-type recombinase/integrase [Anaerolineales bacterium]|nr:tyrosine-type recombinase/integrase [Anaerolineales bacterium]
MLLTDAIDLFLLGASAAGYSQRTIETYRWGLSKLATFAGEETVERLKPERFTAFMAHLRTVDTATGKPLSAGSLRNAYTALRSFARWCEREDVTAEKLDRQLRKPTEPDKHIEPYTRDEIARLLYACQWQRLAKPSDRRAFRASRSTAVRDHALLVFMLDTGARVGEACRCNVEDLDRKLGRVWLVEHGSGRKSSGRYVYTSETTLRVLATYLDKRKPDSEEPLFVARGRRRLTRFSVKNLLVGIGARAGVPNVHAHRFRHTFAIEYLRNGGDVFTLQAVLGHRDIKTTRRYLALVDRDVANVHRRASPVDSWGL